MEEQGPACYENWRSGQSGRRWSWVFEVSLFTDADVRGEIQEGLQPFQFLNTGCPDTEYGKLRPAFVLRYFDHREDDAFEVVSRLSSGVTDDQRYHGGDHFDELAALVSLSMGIRATVGGITRKYYPQGDPYGHPDYSQMKDDPALPQGSSQPNLTRAFGPHNISAALELLQTFFSLQPASAVAVVRCARIYQEAIWLAESSPELCWIMLVSAIEAAAGFWRAETEDSTDRLRSSRPDLERVLIQAGGQDHLTRVAELMAPYMGATRKFIDFVMEFLPDPPQPRPPDHLALNWGIDNIKDVLGKVYGYRSQALHGGIPFPDPMCEPPMPNAEGGSAEIPYGHGASSLGGVWQEKDLPILLDSFEYMSRNALINWWRSLAS